jgi:hypothetical protein
MRVGESGKNRFIRSKKYFINQSRSNPPTVVEHAADEAQVGELGEEELGPGVGILAQFADEIC